MKGKINYKKFWDTTGTCLVKRLRLWYHEYSREVFPEDKIVKYKKGGEIPMGMIDTVTIKYLQQNEVFADAFNFLVYGGKKVIDPESLEELDTKEIDVPYGGANGAEQPVQKTRDVIKSVTAMTDKKTAYLVLAIESQANIHYAMPVKNLVYDALQYAKQVQKAVSSHKKSGDYKNAGGDEYLSGFMKEDHLIPVVTLVMYFGVKAWDGPLSVHEMFEDPNEAILPFVPDYKINLIAPAAIPDEDFDKFSTTLKEVLSFIKYSNDADKLGNLLNSDEGFRKLGRKEVDVLNSCVSAKLAMSESEEVLDVCEAIQIMNERAAAKAAADAREAAAKAAAKAAADAREAAAKAAAKAAADAREAANVTAAKRLLRLGKLSNAEIAEAFDLSVEEVETLASKESI